MRRCFQTCRHFMQRISVCHFGIPLVERCAGITHLDLGRSLSGKLARWLSPDSEAIGFLISSIGQSNVNMIGWVPPLFGCCCYCRWISVANRRPRIGVHESLAKHVLCFSSVWPARERLGVGLTGTSYIAWLLKAIIIVLMILLFFAIIVLVIFIIYCHSYSAFLLLLLTTRSGPECGPRIGDWKCATVIVS